MGDYFRLPANGPFTSRFQSGARSGTRGTRAGGDVAGASGAARGTNTATLAGERDQELVATPGAAETRASGF